MGQNSRGTCNVKVSKVNKNPIAFTGLPEYNKIFNDNKSSSKHSSSSNSSEEEDKKLENANNNNRIINLEFYNKKQLSHSYDKTDDKYKFQNDFITETGDFQLKYNNKKDIENIEKKREKENLYVKSKEMTVKEKKRISFSKKFMSLDILPYGGSTTGWRSIC